jgi:hypothetical protein
LVFGYLFAGNAIVVVVVAVAVYIRLCIPAIHHGKVKEQKIKKKQTRGRNENKYDKHVCFFQKCATTMFPECRDENNKTENHNNKFEEIKGENRMV